MNKAFTTGLWTSWKLLSTAVILNWWTIGTLARDRQMDGRSMIHCAYLILKLGRIYDGLSSCLSRVLVTS